jgi:3-oxoacyl-[acyl-carrier protein] reductase
MATKSVAIVTGASQGIGRATALRLARDFSAIVLVARDMDNLEKTAAEVTPLGAETMVLALDLRQPESAKTVVEGTVERFGRIDALLNIAGAVPQIDLFQMTDARWDDGMALKFHGARRLTIEAWNVSIPAAKFGSGAPDEPHLRIGRRKLSAISRNPSSHGRLRGCERNDQPLG